MEIVTTLIQMLVVQLEKAQGAIVLPFETLIPWILLHRVLSFEESSQDTIENKKVNIPQQESDGQTTAAKISEIPSGGKEAEVNGIENKGWIIFLFCFFISGFIYYLSINF